MAFLYGERKGDAILDIYGLQVVESPSDGVEAGIAVTYSVGVECIVWNEEVDMSIQRGLNDDLICLR